MNESLPVHGERHFKTGKRLEEAHMGNCNYVMINNNWLEKSSLFDGMELNRCLYLKIKINLRVAPSEALKSHLLSIGALSIN